MEKTRKVRGKNKLWFFAQLFISLLLFTWGFIPLGERWFGWQSNVLDFINGFRDGLLTAAGLIFFIYTIYELGKSRSTYPYLAKNQETDNKKLK